MHVGDDEIMLSDSTRLAEYAKSAGVDATLKVWEGMFHVFHAFPFLLEARQAVDQIGAFALKYLVQVTTWKS